MQKRWAVILFIVLTAVLLAGLRGYFVLCVDRPLVQAGTSGESREVPVVSQPATDIGVPEEEAVGCGLTVHFIDVGQGDAILIQTPVQNVLVDGGNRGTRVVNYLSSLGVAYLDLVIATHPHADHIGGLIDVFGSVAVGEVIDPGIVHTTKLYEEYLTLIERKDILYTEGRAGLRRDLGGGAVMLIVHPADPLFTDINEASIVIKVAFGRFSLMLAGDAEEASEKQILSRGYDLEGNVLKVGHHGSRGGTTMAFLDAIGPKAAVIMAGRGNRYGHPHPETQRRLGSAGVDIYRTDIHGTIVITTDGQTFEVNQKQPYQFNPPKIPEVATGAAGLSPGGVGIKKVNINTVGFEELQEIIHIGPDRARQIMELRPFGSLEELVNVKGIGPVRLEEIKKEGKACVE